MKHDAPDLCAIRDDDIKYALEEIRAYRALEWKRDWCKKHRKNLFVSPPPIASAPEPTDEDLHWPENMVSVYWDTGYITMTVDALQKLPAKQRNKISKLGGLA